MATPTSGSGAYMIDDLRKVIISPDGSLHRTTPRAYRLLLFLHLNTGAIFSELDLVHYVWGDGVAQPDIVRATIKRLRDDIAGDVVDTVYRYGYGVGVKENDNG